MNLLDICQNSLKEKKLHEDKRYVKRLKWELEEITAKEKDSYFFDLYTRKVRYPSNENNLLVCWLLGIVDDYDIDKDPNCFYGDMPDIDTDLSSPLIREHIRTVWAPKTFGVDRVCHIGSYTTFGLKNALIDMARVHGESREEIQAITKVLDAKDDEGKVMTWDSAMRLFPELKKYSETYPQVADAAKRLLNRNRGTGVHAGGLIISSVDLPDFVPLMKRKDSPQASAWPEGLHGQDLQPVGLIKFDQLLVSSLLQIALCCELIKTRHNIESICALPNQPDWSDVDKWKNDPKSIKMANSGKLKGIFQFDSETVRSMARLGGVDCFEDLVAYTSLNRPGPLCLKMQERYIERKKKREKYTLHPLIKPILGKTYGVICYQEQIMQMLNVVGEIPLRDCYQVIKAISKKKIDGFKKYKEMFLEKGQKNLNVTLEEITHLWNQIESFAEYGFNLSHAVSYTYISMWTLYLKANFPNEFYASILSCEKETDKIKDLKMEAKQLGVHLNSVDINKSGINFELKDDVIYYGFSKIKGIGEGPSERLIKSQPYSSFEDFLTRFGTDASVLKPLIGLRCFKDSDPVTLWKFTEYFKKKIKKHEDKEKRLAASLAKYDVQFREIVKDDSIQLSDLSGDQPFNSEDWKKFDINDEVITIKKSRCKEGEGEPKLTTEYVDVAEGVVIEKEVFKWYKKREVVKLVNRLDSLRHLWKRRQRTLAKSETVKDKLIPKLAEFNAEEHQISEELLLEFRDPVACEEKYLGFAWVHELEYSPDFKGGYTFEALKSNIEVASAPVEIQVKKLTKAKSKKGTTYYQVLAEDVTGQENKIYVWQEDSERWGEEFKVGNLLRVRLQPPSGGWNTFTLEANHVGKWRNQKRYEDKKDDPRVILMTKGKKESEKFLSDKEALEKFSSCLMDK